MDDLYELLRAGQLVVYGALGAIALVQWRRRPTASTAWLAATFATLGAVIIAARFVPGEAENQDSLARTVIVAGIVLFPYFLFRFTNSLVASHALIARSADGLTAGLVIATFLVEIPLTGEPRSSAFMAYLYALVVQWVGLMGFVTARLWGGGRAQPHVARVRMRLLGAGAFGIAAALVVAAFAPQTVSVGVEDIAGQVLALLSGPLFLLGFSPPGILRAWWRQRTLREMLPAELALMEATTTGEVGTIVLPQASGLMGGRGAVLATNDGAVLGRYALREDEANALVTQALNADTHGGLISVPLQNGVLAVEAVPFTPFFGRDESDLLSRVAVLADLAMNRAQLLEQQRSAVEQLREAQAVARVGSWEWDIERDEITWSDEFYRIFGYDRDAVVPSRELAVQRIHPADRDRVASEVEAMLADPRATFVSEYRIALSDFEERVVHARGRAEIADDGTMRRMVGTVQDITARKREEQVRDQFIANAAHELRTPLTALLGFMQLLTDASSLTQEQQRSATSAVHRAGERLGTLVNNLLDLTKLRQGNLAVELELVDVAAVVDDVVAMVPSPPDRELRIDSAPGTVAMTHRQRLEQVLVNLLTNAYRYGGPRVQVAVSVEPSTVCVRVSDNGAGVEPELVPHLFEPFTRGPDSAKVGGSGLGLAIAAATAQAIGGSLSYDVPDEGGSRFTLELKAPA